MARETKVRPSLTSKDCVLIASVLEREITNRISAGQVSSANVIRLAQLKDYLLSFQSDDERVEALVQQRLAAMGIQAEPMITATEIPETTLTEPNYEQSDVSAAISPIDRTDLTDDQIFDLLALRDSNKRTEAENHWWLAKGTWIKMAREGKQVSNVGASDL